MKHQMLMKEKKELHKRIQKKMWLKICLPQNLKTMSFVNMMTKFEWHSSALTIKRLMILKLNCCIRVDITNIIAILKYKTLAIWTKKYLENIGCSIRKIRNSQDPILLQTKEVTIMK